MKNLLHILLCMLLILLTGPLFADADAGIRAYHAKDYIRASRLLQASVDQGDHLAEFLLSSLYLEGLGVKKDEVKALRLLRKSAEGGFPEAQFNLGNNYFHGIAVGRDYPAAVDWWTRAANQDDMKAQFNLGFAYLRGKGVEKDPHEAVRWFEKAAINGSLPASRMLDELREGQNDNLQVSKIVEKKNHSEKPEPTTPAVPETSMLQPPAAREIPEPANMERKQVPEIAAVMSQQPAAALPVHPSAGDASSISTNDSTPSSPQQPYAVSPPVQAAPAVPAPAQKYVFSDKPPAAQSQQRPAQQEAPQQTVKPPYQPESEVHLASWFQSRSPEHYTIQVYVDNDRQKALNFAEQINAGRVTGLFYSSMNGKKVWGVVVGEYPNLQAAQQARQTLPLDQWNRPGWFLSFDDIQKRLIVE